jgi:electron transport complex protein RnfC
LASIFNRSLKGVKTPHRKNTRDIATVDMPVPNRVCIVMSQHMGPPCNILVAPGDSVRVGQVIGDSDAFLSAPVHSSVSGTVTAIDEIIMPNGVRSKAAVIDTDGAQELHPDVKPPVINSRQEFINAVHASGIVGLGGAGFPTHIKLAPKNLESVDTLVINAAECEPYITSDYRASMEEAEDILTGIRAVMKHLSLAKCVIGVEDNKPEAIARLRELVRDEPGVSVFTLKSKYPQGAEKVLIYEALGRVVGEGKLPADVGAIVTNVTTADKIAGFLRDGIPLISKRITVDGGAVKTPMNVNVLIGTPIRAVFDFCGGFKAEPKKLIMGGPMMGTAVYDENYPVLKNNNALLAFDEPQVERYSESDCIRCGRCVYACPFNLMPLRIEDAFLKEDNAALSHYKVNLCMECGCCAYVCPAKRHLVQVNRLAKARLRAYEQQQNKK